MIKYNSKYDLYIDEDLVIYYWDNKLDKLLPKEIHKNFGYQVVTTKFGCKRVHRIIYETFIGEIPKGYEIDHINTIRNDNRLTNLRLVTHKENMNNKLSRKHISESKIGNTNAKGKPTSDFGIKFKEHYGITWNQDKKLYNRELVWYYRHNHKCSWE